MAADYELTLNDYLQILRRRAYHIAGAFCALFAITLVVTVALPPIYQSSGTILIESQQIPADLLQGSFTTYVDERIEVIKQHVMTRENLLRIIDKYKLNQESDFDRLSPSEQIDKIREAIVIELISAERARIKYTIAFKLTFENRSPEVAQQITNELVTLYLAENVKSRTDRAVQTTEFFSQEANRLKANLEKTENDVAAYKQLHANELPEHLELRMKMVGTTESELKDLDRDYRDTQERMKYLEIELTAAKAGVGSEGVSATGVSPLSELEKLQAEYTKLSAVYSENHPDVRALKRKIQALEKNPTEPVAPFEKKGPSENVLTNLKVAKIQAHIDDANTRLASLDQQRKSLRNKLEQLQGQIMRAPQVEHGMAMLLRDYEIAKKKYDEIKAKESSATITTNLEQESKGERFTLIDPPVLSDKPVRPDRIKILLIGLALSIGAAGGGVFMLESMGNRIWGVGALTTAIRHPPLAVIPYITTSLEIAQRKRRLRLAVSVLIAMTFIVALLVQFFYMPLNVLLFKIAARFA